MSGEGMSELALFLEKQRQMRELSEELEQLKSNRAVESAMRIKHEIEALLADYELTPEQLLEALCSLFDLAKPFGYGVKPLLDDQDTEDDGDKAGKAPTSSSESDVQGGQSKKDRRQPGSTGQVMVPAKSVTISSRRARSGNRSAGGVDGSPSAGASTGSNAKSSSGTGKSVKAPGKVRKPRGKRRYTNPHTKEQVVTRGGNHRVINQWRSEYGADEVDQWWVAEKD